MKALLVTILVLFSFQASALDTNFEQMTKEQQVQLIKVLNTLEPEVLSAVLSEEALDWYIEQFNRLEATGVYPEDVDVATGSVEGIGGFDDPDAPQFL